MVAVVFSLALFLDDIKVLSTLLGILGIRNQCFVAIEVGVGVMFVDAAWMGGDRFFYGVM